MLLTSCTHSALSGLSFTDTQRSETLPPPPRNRGHHLLQHMKSETTVSTLSLDSLLPAEGVRATEKEEETGGYTSLLLCAFGQDGWAALGSFADKAAVAPHTQSTRKQSATRHFALSVTPKPLGLSRCV